MKIEDSGPTIANGDHTTRHSLSSIVDPLSSPRMWRSLDELAQTAEYREAVQNEFPAAADVWDDDASRRTFLKIMGASIALAGVSAGVGGCVKPTTEKIVPYVRQPEEMTPGKPLYFATSATFRGFARGIVAESHEGRPTKIEGNELHPSSLGAADAITQAHVLNLYDPDRSQIVTNIGEVSNWNGFTKLISGVLEEKKASGGQGVRLLTGTVTSPTLNAQMEAFLGQYPNARWHQYEPINSDNEKLGLTAAFGRAVQPVYRFDQAKVVVSLDANFLMDLAGSVRYAREFIDGRRVLPKHGKNAMNRLYVAESAPTIAGAFSDERVRVKPSEILTIARSLLAGTANTPFLDKALGDLNRNHGASIIIAGEGQPPEVHAIAAALNDRLGNVGKTVEYIDPVEFGYPSAGQTASLQALVNDMNSNAVDVLIMIGGNPAYDAPVDFKFADALKALSGNTAKHTVHMSLYYDETSFLSQWHLPLAHELEVWGDARGHDGTASILQPLIAALYQGKSPHILLSILLGQPNRGGYEIVREYWQNARPGNDFDAQWNKWLNDGVVTESASKAVTVALTANATAQTATGSAGGREIIFRPDPFIWDGRYANNGWLMECPRPLTKLVWDNAAIMSPKTAKDYGALSDDYTARPRSPMVEITANNQPPIKAPIWILPGHPDDCVTVHLGFGRMRAGRIGGNLDEQPGFNAFALRSSTGMWSQANVAIKTTDDELKLACVQNHAMMDQHERGILHIRAFGEKPGGEESEAPRTVSLSLYPPYPYPDDVRKGNKWGMVIDQNACIGCHACVIACQSENNIPVVGKEQVGKGREMHWLRIDHYYRGDSMDEAEGPFFQPLPCMHCENAPCEVVCPANATMHDQEGTNNMVYNRCIGTRYCSNNCPYKVRHFNFFAFSQDWHNSEVQKMVNNPNVTVRSRGVMEKCTYCIQRISAARINSKKEFVNKLREDDAIYDGEVVTACQQSCPTEAIYFGNLNDKDLSRKGAGSVVRTMAEEEGNYSLLDEELQTRPRTTYLPRYTNRAEKA